jgi:hypothetical protein
VAGGHRRPGGGGTQAAVAGGRRALLVEEVPEVFTAGGKELLPRGGWAREASSSSVASPSSNTCRAASEIFSSALAREIQRADSPVVNWFWRTYVVCSSGPWLWTTLRRRSIECSSTRA